MNKKKQILVSMFDNIKSSRSYTVVDIRQWLLSNHLQDVITQIRITQDKVVRRTLKCKLPAITPSGIFHRRNSNGLVEPSSLICIDIDGKDNPSISDMEKLKKRLGKLSYIMYVGLSASGTGLFCIIPYTDYRNHKLYFNSLKLEFEKMGIIIDKSCSDITRLRLASYDEHPYLNWDAVPYEKTLDENDCIKVRDLIKTEILQDNIADNKVNGFDFVANQLLKPTNLDLAHVIPQSKKNEVVRLVNVIIESKVDITRNYQDWFTICCIIKNYFGAGGIVLFHDISKLYPNYSPEETEKLYSSIKQWQYRYRSDRLFEIAAKYGIL